MSYKISKSKKNLNYYSDLEIEELRKKYKGHTPFFESERVGTRMILKMPERVRRKNQVVSYKENLAVVRKVTRNGIYIEEFKTDKSGLSYPSGKIKFISNENAEHNLYPTTYPDVMVADLLI
jgi:hypothetical protein